MPRSPSFALCHPVLINAIARRATGLAAGLLLLATAGCGDASRDSAEGESTPMAVQFEEGADATASTSGAIGDAFGTGSRGRMVGDASGKLAAVPAPAAPPPAPQVDRDVQASQGQTSTAVPEPGASIVPPMLIRTGNAVIEVDSLEIAISEVRLLAQRLGGFIANTSMQTGRGQIRSATLELKIPAARFDEATGGLEPIGKVESVNEHSEDVGEEFVDLTARMTNAKRLEERLVTLLATRTGKLEDVLAVERELARVREQIERYEGRMRYLRTRAAISTLSVTVHEPRPLVGNNPGRSVIGEAFRNAWRNFVRFFAGLIEAMGVLIPLAVIGVLGWLLWRRFGPSLPPRKPPAES